MTDIQDKELADRIDQEVASREGLLALMVCLSATVGLAAAGVATLLGAF